METRKTYMGEDYTNQVIRYEKAQSEYIINLQQELARRGVKSSQEYSQSYYTNFGLSDMNDVSIKLEGLPNKYKNNSVSISTYMNEAENTPYILNIWKYTGSNHIFDRREFVKIDDKAIKLMADFVIDKMELKVVEPKIEQMQMNLQYI